MVKTKESENSEVQRIPLPLLLSSVSASFCRLLWELSTRPAACSSGEKWRSLRAVR